MIYLRAVQLSSIDLNLLVILDTLLDTASVNLAARRLALSASATSHALARLRDLLGDPLLVRSGQRLVRTPRAERLQPQVRALMDGVRTLLQPEVAFDPARLNQRFTVAANDYMAAVVLRPLSRELARLAPGVDLHVVSVHESTFDQLRNGTLDLAMGAFPEVPPDIYTEELFRDRYVCLVRKGHPVLSRKLTVRRFAALEHLLIAPRGTPFGRVDQELGQLGLKRRIARTVVSFQLGPQMVAESDYITTMSARIAKGLVDQLGLVMLEPPLPLKPYGLRQIWDRRRDTDTALSWLREQARAVGAALPPV